MKTEQIVSWLKDKAARAEHHSYQRMLTMAARRLEELTAERDSMAEYMKCTAACSLCKHGHRDADDEPCKSCYPSPVHYPKWEWKGEQPWKD